ncbi:VPLPA-CTERM sorting domain-containing protein [Sedimentitalea sp. HM32M-2]|uniref:VPLPA-CTERM sorting domain-containing protein n=1 Tax=Sedimentitalea sp. HM32M-2 TaxID=3351566 RepID=UPI0036449C33
MMESVRTALSTGALSLAVLFSVQGEAQAATMFSSSATVGTVDRVATFDSLTSNGIDLSTYTEASLSVTVSDVTFQGFSAFSPNDSRTTGFHYGSGGNDDFVTIKGTDGAVFTALDFLLGDGQSGTTTNVRWQAYRGGVLTGSGTESNMARGTVMGWSDIDGFDTLLVAAARTVDQPGFGNHQSVAIDDLRAQVGVTPVPLPAGLPLMIGGLAAFGLLRRRQQA